MNKFELSIKMYVIHILLTFLLIFIQDSISLRALNVTIPGYRMRGESASLFCGYDLDRDSLYSVKWYKDNEEFYRFMPKMNPAHHSFKVEGIKIDHHNSDEQRVTLKGLTLKSSGIYRCDVSAEAPTYASAHAEGRLEVIYVPKDGPHISGLEELYRYGDMLLLNCTSGRSHPAPILQWFLNDEKIIKSEELEEYSPAVHQFGLLTSTLGVHVRLRAQHFRRGPLRARCTSHISPKLWSSNRAYMLQQITPQLDNREAFVLVTGGSSRWLISSPMIILSMLVLGLTK